MDYKVREKGNFTRLKKEVVSDIKKDITLKLISILSDIVSLSIGTIFIIKAILLLDTNYFSWGIDIFLLCMLFISLFVSIKLSDKIDLVNERLKECIDKDKELIQYLNHFVVLENGTVNPVYKYLITEKSSEYCLVFHYPVGSYIVFNELYDEPDSDSELYHNAYVHYGRTHYKPIKKRQMIKFLKQNLKANNELKQHIRREIEDEYYADIQQNNKKQRLYNVKMSKNTKEHLTDVEKELAMLEDEQDIILENYDIKQLDFDNNKRRYNQKVKQSLNHAQMMEQQVKEKEYDLKNNYRKTV